MKEVRVYCPHCTDEDTTVQWVYSAVEQGFTPSRLLPARRLFSNTVPTVMALLLSLVRQKPGGDALKCKYFVLPWGHLISIPLVTHSILNP